MNQGNAKRDFQTFMKIGEAYLLARGWQKVTEKGKVMWMKPARKNELGSIVFLSSAIQEQFEQDSYDFRELAKGNFDD